MILTTEQIKKVVADYFKDKPVNKVYLFGSYARGDANRESDVDLLVDLDYENGAGWEFFGWEEELKSQMNRKVDVVTSGGLLRDRLFTRFVNKEKVLMYAKPA